MPSIYGEKIHISIFGQSHSAAIGVVIDGLPAGVKIDMAELGRFMARTACTEASTLVPLESLM